MTLFSRVIRCKYYSYLSYTFHFDIIHLQMPPEDVTESIPVRSNFIHSVHYPTGYSPKDHSQYISISSAPPHSSVHPFATGVNEIPDVSIEANLSNNNTNNNNKITSTLFLQLSIEDLGVCLPIHMVKVCLHIWIHT